MGKFMQLITRLLVVEDDAAMNMILRDFLHNQGYSVTTTTSVNGALKSLKANAPHERPALVLSDVMLGALTGMDLCQTIIVDYPGIPVVLFSVFDQLETEALKSGARRFLKKPFALEILADVLNEELNVCGP
jgi:DNA-binding response OmpR family regulator